MKISNIKFQIKKSFTLLELLVVIGIIAILVSLGFASYSTAQKKARDAKRQSDLKSAQQLMEQCYSINSFKYPLLVSVVAGTIATTCPTDATLTFSISDPLNSGTHMYTSSTSTSTYTITATLETSATAYSVKAQQEI